MIKIVSKNILSEQIKQKIILKLNEYLKNNLKADDITYETDKTIIAGIKIIIGSKVIDLTINRKLEKITNLITNS